MSLSFSLERSSFHLLNLELVDQTEHLWSYVHMY